MQEITCRRHGPFFNVPLGLRPQRIKLYALEPEKKNGCAEVGEWPRNAGMSGSDGHEFGFSVVFGVPRVLWKAGLDCSIFGFAARRQPLILTYIIIADNMAAVNICELRSGRSQLAYDHPTFYI